MRKTKQLHLPTADLTTAGAPLFEFAAGKKPEKKVNGSKKSKPLPEPIPDKPAINPVADQFQKCNSCEHSWKNQVGRTPIGWCTMHTKRPIPCSRYKFKPTEVKPETDPVTATFGKPVYSYTRAQAIEDGVLVDVSSLAKEAGFTAPVAMTRTVWDSYVEVPPKTEGQDEKGRLWDILWMCHLAAKKGGEEIKFEFKHRKGKKLFTGTLKAVIGPGDQGEPVITIMMPDED